MVLATSSGDIIPLCHPIKLEAVEIEFKILEAVSYTHLTLPTSDLV